jgi:hypothetical protein
VFDQARANPSAGLQIAPPTMSMTNILNLARLPARLDGLQTSEFLGIQPHDITTLVHAGLLKPLAHPKPNAPKFFAAVEVEELARDRHWIEKAQRAIQRHWQIKNQTA